MILLLIILSILLAAIGDGLKDSGYKVVGHLLRALETLSLLLLCLTFTEGWLVVNIMKAITFILIFVSLNISAQTDKLCHGISGMMIGRVT